MRVHELVVAAALALAAFVAVAPAAAQSPVDPAKLMHVHTLAASYDKTGPKRWQQTTWVDADVNGAKTRRFATADLDEVRVDAKTLVLSKTLPGRKDTVTLDLGRRTFEVAFVQLPRPGDTALVGGISSQGAITEAWADCKSTAAAAAASGNAKCTCDLGSLRPLQVAAGLGEVAKKQKDIEKNLAAELQALEQDPIKIVRGFAGDFFVVDHHHGALAFIQAFEATHRPAPAQGTCELFAALPVGDAFWVQVQKPVRDQLVARFADENGIPFDKGELQSKLPPTLAKMRNDPYRTLAWMLRKQDGFCRALMAQSDFAEFQWADWMRTRPELPPDQVRRATDPTLWTETKKKDREAKQERLLKTAKTLALAKDAGASDRPGYNGKAHLTGAACNPKDDG